MSALYILPCSATKARTLEAGPLPARDAYTGQGFRKLREQLEREGLKWCILSAWYGFLWPDTPIEAYDVKMTPLKPGEPWDECFAMLTDRQYGRLNAARGKAGSGVSARTRSSCKTSSTSPPATTRTRRRHFTGSKKSCERNCGNERAT